MNGSINPMEEYKYCPNCGRNLISSVIDKEERKKCNGCGFIFWNNPKPVVSALIEKDGKVLMLQRKNEPFKDYWVLPGGFIGYSETAQEAIKREAKEEMGIDIQIDGLIGIYRIDDDPRGVHVDIIFHTKATEEVTLSEEDKKWNYFPPQELPKNIAYKHRNAIEDWYLRGGQYDKTRHF